MGTREYNRVYARERYYWRKAHGICTNCGKEDAEPHKVLCAECAEKKQYTAKRYWDDLPEEAREKAIQRVSTRRRSLKAQGLCVGCGRKAAKGKAHCIECLLKARRNSRARRDAEWVKTNFKEGLCSRCNEPVVPGQKLCTKHLEIARRCAEAARKGLTNAKHPWRGDNNMAFGKKKKRPSGGKRSEREDKY